MIVQLRDSQVFLLYTNQLSLIAVLGDDGAKDGGLYISDVSPSPSDSKTAIPHSFICSVQSLILLSMRGLLSLTALVSTLAVASSAAVGARAPSCSGPVKSSPTTYWLAKQDHTGNPRGYAPNAGGNYNYPVWRNVLDYSAKNDGSGDQTASLQKAINDNGSGGSRESSGVTRYPAQVYLPSGTYQLGSTLNLRVGTLIVGDPINPPVIKAAAGFNGDTLVNGYDSKNGPPETSFMTLMKNVVLDTTALRPDTRITALQWGVAQGAGLTNVKINMPNYSTGHTGIRIQGGSTIAITDVVGPPSSVPWWSCS
jgi:hypothetical protein